MSSTRIALRICKKLKPLFPNDATYLKTRFWLEMGYSLNLNHPKMFSEKLQWLKLNDHRQEYTMMVDKYAVKDYVANKIGAEHVIPLLGIWDSPEEIEWDKLPERFVLKTTHGGGGDGVIICRNKKTIDKKKVNTKLRASLHQDIAHYSCEWPYKNVPRRILAEEFLTDEKTSVGGDLNDYKFYCFNGKVKYCEVITGRNTNKQIDFFDLDWNHMEFNFDDYDFADVRPEKPHCFDEMVRIAGVLCKDLPFSRIDLYVVNNTVYFGEITLYPASGFKKYSPKEWNRKLGDFITLPKHNNN